MTAEELVLRTMVEHQRLPLAAIEDVAVRQVLAVRVGDKRYVSTAIGKSWRKAMVGAKPRRGGKDADKPATEVAYADYVEQRDPRPDGARARGDAASSAALRRAAGAGGGRAPAARVAAHRPDAALVAGRSCVTLLL